MLTAKQEHMYRLLVDTYHESMKAKWASTPFMHWVYPNKHGYTLEEYENLFKTEEVVGHWSDRKATLESRTNRCRLVLKNSVIICAECKKLEYCKLSYNDLCAECNPNLAVRVAAEIYRKHKKVDFNSNWLVMNPKISIVTMDLMVAESKGGAFKYIGTIHFSENSVDIKVKTVRAITSSSHHSKTWVFNYADPRLFDKVHHFLETITRNSTKAYKLSRQKSWNKTLRGRRKNQI